MVTLKVLAQRAGVSVSLVSAVLNDNRHVRMSEQTRQRVLAEIEKANYVPNHAARSLRLSRTQVLAVVIPGIAKSVFESLLDGIYAGAQEAGLVVLLGDARHMVSGAELLERILGQGQVDGTIVRHANTLDPQIIAELAKRGAPLVVLDEVEDERFTWVSVEERRGAELGTQHLIESGHTDIGFIGGVRRPGQESRRLLGYLDAMAAAGLRVRDEWIVPSTQETGRGFDAMRRLLELERRPSALFVNNIVGAKGVVAAAVDAGMSVPRDISIVAIHDLPDAEFDRPAITTVELPMYELGLEGVRMFERLRRGEEVGSHKIATPPRLIVRESTRSWG